MRKAWRSFAGQDKSAQINGPDGPKRESGILCRQALDTGRSRPSRSDPPHLFGFFAIGFAVTRDPAQ